MRANKFPSVLIFFQLPFSISFHFPSGLHGFLSVSSSARVSLTVGQKKKKKKQGGGPFLPIALLFHRGCTVFHQCPFLLFHRGLTLFYQFLFLSDPKMGRDPLFLSQYVPDIDTSWNWDTLGSCPICNTCARGQISISSHFPSVSIFHQGCTTVFHQCPFLLFHRGRTLFYRCLFLSDPKMGRDRLFLSLSISVPGGFT